METLKNRAPRSEAQRRHLGRIQRNWTIERQYTAMNNHYARLDDHARAQLRDLKDELRARTSFEAARKFQSNQQRLDEIVAEANGSFDDFFNLLPAIQQIAKSNKKEPDLATLRAIDAQEHAEQLYEQLTKDDLERKGRNRATKKGKT